MIGICNGGRVPISALGLGYLGALPFVIFTLLETTSLRINSFDTLLALNAYGAVILSFLGGAQWGFATQCHSQDTSDNGDTARNFCLSIIPSLLGWAGLIVDDILGLWVLISGFVLVLFMDFRMVKLGLAPDWYPKLRMPLTLIVVSCLVLTALLNK